jgi:hypothetical protein
MYRLLFALSFCLAACGDGSIDVLVVVQETNVPDPPDPCDGRVRQDVDGVIRICDQTQMPVRVVLCSDEPLCQEAVDAIVDAVESCDETRLSFEVESICE